MKFARIIAALAAIAVGASLAGCSDSEKSGNSDGKIKVIATIFPAYDFSRQVFGDNAEVTMLLSPGQESHSFDPSAKDIVEISNCDLFVYNGGESDEWVESVLKSNPDLNTFKMSDAVNLLEEEVVEGMDASHHHDHDEHDHDHEHDEDEIHDDHDHDEHDHDEDEEEYDEHVWTSPENAAKIVDKLGEKAAELFPDKSEQLLSNAKDYSKKIHELDDKFAELFKNEDRYFVFGDRFPLLYFFREYGLNYYAAFPGCGTATEPSAKTIAFLTEKLNEGSTVPAVFCIELSGGRIASVIAGDSGIPIAEFHTCHNIDTNDFAGGASWLSLMEKNYNMLQHFLKES